MRLMALAGLFFALFLPASGAAENHQALRAGKHNEVINGVRLSYRIAGQSRGTPVVFLHGGPGQGSNTFASYPGPYLERANRMIYLDQRGSGQSEKHWRKEYSLELMVDDIEKLRRLWNVKQIKIVGHSFGTVLALEYAAKYPQRVSHLVLSGAVVDVPAASNLHCARLEETDPESYLRAVARLPAGSTKRCHIFAAPRSFFDGAMFPDPAIMKLVNEADSADGMRNTGEVFSALAARGFMEYQFSSHQRLTMPVLVVAGAKDFQAVVEPLRAFVASVPRSELFEYEGRGHFMFVEDPVRFASDLTAFFRRRR